MKKLHYTLFAVGAIAVAVACSPKTAGTATNTEGSSMSKKKFIDEANMNKSVRPQDDFYEYINGGWIQRTPIPASESRWGSFNELNEFNTKALREICDDVSANPGAKGQIRQKVGDFYAAGMDSMTIEKAGIAPLKPYLDRIAAIKNYAGLLNELALEYSEGMGSAFGLSARPDAKSSTTTVAHLSQGGLNLPDRDYYLKDDERSKKIRTAYEEHIFNTFKLLGNSDAKAKAAVLDIMKMEKGFAQVQMTRVERRDPKKTYNKMTIADLEKVCPQMQWASFLKTAGAGATPYIIVDNPKFFEKVNDFLKTGQLEDWKTYLTWTVTKDAMPYLSSAFVNEGFKMAQVLTGQKEMQPRWKRVSRMTDGVLGEALGQIYVDKYFKPEAKTRMLTLVDNLLKTYQTRINSLDWMSAETKARAQQKLSTFVRKIGYTDKWQDYTPLSIDRSKSYAANVMAARQFLRNDNMSRIGKPIDRTKWGMTPPTVNAYYNPTMNEIVFPAGILQFPFFDNDADDAINYGGIGAVIGHEISHGFDDQGRQFDQDGNLKDWWTADDGKKFDAKATRIADLYSSFTVLDTLHVNGRLTLGENIADFGGLSVAYEAFKTYSPQGKSASKIDGFTPDQRLFIGWAQVWRSKYRDEALAQQILTDPHSPGKYRCNAPLQNMPEFYNAFGVKQGDKMWRSETDRAKIW